MTQTISTLLRLRELIVSGQLPPGERLSELSVVDRLGVSRTPVRAALARLEEEGLLEPLPSGGYAIRDFTEREIADAIELRGTLEGLAARLAAERGCERARLDALSEIVDGLDGVVSDTMTNADFAAYVEWNARFHSALIALPDSPHLARQIERAVALPFASPSAFVMAQAVIPEARRHLSVAQDQHRCVVDAIARREGGRAEAIMREHARLAHRNVQRVLADRSVLHLVAGGALFSPRATG